MIRKADTKDYEEIKKLVLQVHYLHLEKRPDIYIDNDPLEKEFFEQIILDTNTIMLVYEEDEKIFGYVQASLKENNAISIARNRKVVFVDDIVVDEKSRKKGIGHKLFKEVEEIAKDLNADSIELNVWAFNEDAIAFYESLGMTVKNMKLEKVLNTQIKTNNINVNITSTTSDI